MSKNRKKGRKPDAHHRAQNPALAGDQAEVESSSGAKEDDEFVYVPRGKSKGTYIFILGLMVFTLIIFVVPGQFQALFDPREDTGNDVFMSWEHPRLGRQEVTGVEFSNERRRLNSFYYFFGVRDERLTEYEAIASFLVTDALAKEAGVEVSRSDLTTAILEGEAGRLQGFQQIGGQQAYLQRLQQLNMPGPTLEATLRDVLRVWRYQALLAAVAGAWQPESLEESWKGRHGEYRFELIEAVVADYIETAEGELPEAAELQTWYEALPPRTGAFASDWIGERVSAEVMGYPLDAAGDPAGAAASAPTALLEKYPAPEGTDEAAAARDYYDRTFHARFRRETPLEDEEDARSRIYESYEEVEAVALLEAPIHRALGLWLGDLRIRLESGEELDLAAETAELGLTYQAPGEAMDLTGWREAETWGGSYVGSGLFRADAQGLVPDVVVDENGLSIAHVVEKLAAGPTPYADVADKVAEEWAKERAGELALEGLQAAYGVLLGETELAVGEKLEVDGQAFAAQAGVLGLEVQTRDWFDKAERDPPGYEPTPLELYTRQATWRLALEENQVGEPALDSDGDRAWLARCSGQREPPELRISPSELGDLHREANFTGFLGSAELTSFQNYQATYALHLNREEDDAGASEPEDGPEG
jgi:hypothetical protein